jgi:hypothetical protein
MRVGGGRETRLLHSPFMGPVYARSSAERLNAMPERSVKTVGPHGWPVTKRIKRAAVGHPDEHLEAPHPKVALLCDGAALFQ